MDPNFNTLKQVSIFSSLREPHLAELCKIAREKSFPKNSVVFHQNDPGNVLFILKSGAVKISITDDRDKEVILRMIYENDFFGEMSLLDGHFRSATITAVEPSRALIIYREDFIRLIRENAAVVLEMLTVLSRRLRKTDEAIASLTFNDAYGKVARVLLGLMEEQGKRQGDEVVLNLALSRQDLANMAGISRETFIRVLNEFQLRGCLKAERKKIVVFDETVLKREAV
ncbi:MAG: Crp/Fnr family transcriptional regulator [Nitrospinae bacterium]|nr:Crp/Fnr family transcriptional regulator [Nitrospinota bacterium]